MGNPKKMIVKEREVSDSPVDSDGSFEKQLKEELINIQFEFKENLPRGKAKKPPKNIMKKLIKVDKQGDEAEKLRIKMAEAVRIKIPLKEKQPMINKVAVRHKSHMFQTVKRENAPINLFIERKNKESVTSLVNPKFTAIDSQPQKILKWKMPSQEHQFFYENDSKFRSNIDIELAREGSEKRMMALAKLYHEYRNEATF